ncbi:MAG TPA: hypothetical protein VFH56_14210 [Acidimicrobiales bacterium]|nr:hypothetical protein [Acidimicrobiales bacterium]
MEGVDVYPADTVAPNYWAVRAVVVDVERTDMFPIAVVYGLGLIPALVTAFADIREKQMHG